jgi:hypothetical protein
VRLMRMDQGIKIVDAQILQADAPAAVIASKP